MVKYSGIREYSRDRFFRGHRKEDREEFQRTQTRARAITRAEREDRVDEDNWNVIYPSDLVGWVVDVLESVEYKWSPAQILDTERQYPGLINDLSTEIWQRKIIAGQMKKNSE